MLQFQSMNPNINFMSFSIINGMMNPNNINMNMNVSKFKYEFCNESKFQYE